MSCAIYENAEEGKASAQFAIGESYWRSNDGCFPRDHESALSWYRKAAAGGETRSMTRIADAYRDGLGVSQDSFTAMEWYRKAVEAGHRTPDARTAHTALAAQNAGQIILDNTRSLPMPGAIAVTVGWDESVPVLGKPRGAIAEVGGRLAASVVVGGAFALAGDPVRGAVYGGLLALISIEDGIRSGKAGNAVHETLSTALSELDFEELLRDALRNQIEEARMVPAPTVLPGGSRADPDEADMLVELILTRAALQNKNPAWEFNGVSRPHLNLVVTATVRASRIGAGGAVFRETLEYRGRQALYGEEVSLRNEMRYAARYIGGRILLRLTGIKGPTPVREMLPDVR